MWPEPQLWLPRALASGLERRAGDDHLGLGEGRRVAAADDSADRAFLADRRDFDGPPVGELEAREIIVGPNGK